MIITLSGKAGSGKSTIAKEVAKSLNLKRYSIGDLMRQLAKKRNLTINELSKLAENDKSIDTALDKKNIELREEDNFIIDGRLTAYFIHYADLKVFLDCDDKVRAKRIHKDERTEEKGKNIQDLTKKIMQREQSERKRYDKLYSIDYYGPKLYDLIIDTTNLSIEEVLNEIMEAVDKK